MAYARKDGKIVKVEDPPKNVELGAPKRSGAYLPQEKRLTEPGTPRTTSVASSVNTPNYVTRRPPMAGGSTTEQITGQPLPAPANPLTHVPGPIPTPSARNQAPANYPYSTDQDIPLVVNGKFSSYPKEYEKLDYLDPRAPIELWPDPRAHWPLIEKGGALETLGAVPFLSLARNNDSPFSLWPMGLQQDDYQGRLRENLYMDHKLAPQLGITQHNVNEGYERMSGDNFVRDMDLYIRSNDPFVDVKPNRTYSNEQLLEVARKRLAPEIKNRKRVPPETDR